MSYQVSTKANTDLTNIWEYTFNNWSPSQADRYIELLTSKFKEISNNPDLGKSYEGVRENYRGLPIKSHIIFYRVFGENNIEIIRILHQRMDLINRMQD